VIRRREVGIGVEAPAPEEAPHPPGDGREQDADLFLRRGRCRLEAQRVPFAFGELAIEDERVEVDVESAPPKRWMTVTQPEWPSRMPRCRARWWWKASRART